MACKPLKFQYPKLSKFCFTAAELHAEYGLSLEGKLYQHLGSKHLAEEDWLSVFSRRREAGSKLFLHMLRPEFVDSCRQLFHLVYQAPPVNNELTHKFAMLFAYERCRAATADPNGHKVAWAIFGEQVVEHCRKLPGGIQKKINNWMDQNMNATNTPPSVSMPTSSALMSQQQHSHDAEAGGTLMHDAENVLTIRQAADVIWTENHMKQLHHMVLQSGARVEDTQNALQTKEEELEALQQNMWKTEGQSSAVSLLQSQMKELQTKYDIMIQTQADKSSPSFIAIEAQISALTTALQTLGFDANMDKMKSSITIIQEDICALKAKMKVAGGQSVFCQSLMQRVEQGHRLLVVPTPSVASCDTDDILNVPGFCAACGEMFAAPGYVGVYTLACGHTYHPICFAYWVETESMCALEGCGKNVPQSARLTIVNTAEMHKECKVFVVGATKQSSDPLAKGKQQMDIHAMPNIGGTVLVESRLSEAQTSSLVLVGVNSSGEMDAIDHIVDASAGLQVEGSHSKSRVIVDSEMQSTDHTGMQQPQDMQPKTHIVEGQSDDDVVTLKDMFKASKKRRKNGDGEAASQARPAKKGPNQASSNEPGGAATGVRWSPRSRKDIPDKNEVEETCANASTGLESSRAEVEPVKTSEPMIQSTKKTPKKSMGLGLGDSSGHPYKPRACKKL